MLTIEDIEDLSFWKHGHRKSEIGDFPRDQHYEADFRGRERNCREIRANTESTLEQFEGLQKVRGQ